MLKARFWQKPDTRLFAKLLASTAVSSSSIRSKRYLGLVVSDIGKLAPVVFMEVSKRVGGTLIGAGAEQKSPVHIVAVAVLAKRVSKVARRA